MFCILYRLLVVFENFETYIHRRRLLAFAQKLNTMHKSYMIIIIIIIMHKHTHAPNNDIHT